MSPAIVLALIGCFAHYPLVTTAPASTTAVEEPAPITFSPLEERLEVIFTQSTDGDQRDRLSELRELLHAMRAKDPLAQRRVYDYAERTLKIESRVLPQALPVEEGLEPLAVPIEERPLSETPAGATATPANPAGATATGAVGPTASDPATGLALPMPTLAPVGPTAAELVASARAAFAAADYLAAIATLAPLTSPQAGTLRKEAVDAWSRAEREAAGAAFITARALPAGSDRMAALVTARDRLAAINQRFPDNAFAAAIAENITKVNAELGL